VASNAIQITDVEQSLAKYFGIRGEGRIAPVIAPEVVPCVLVADLTKLTQPGQTTATRYLYAHPAVVTHVGSGAYFEFHNPVGSAHTLRLLRWFFRATTNHVFDFLRLVPSGAPWDPVYSGESSWEDFTLGLAAGGDMSGVIHISTGLVLAGGIVLAAIDTSAGTPCEVAGTNFVLGPGDSMIVQTPTVGGIAEVACRVEVKPLRT